MADSWFEQLNSILASIPLSVGDEPTDAAAEIPARKREAEEENDA
jgi:hypothetical protein